MFAFVLNAAGRSTIKPYHACTGMYLCSGTVCMVWSVSLLTGPNQTIKKCLSTSIVPTSKMKGVLALY